ncbi:MAG: hypothetical protein SFU98_02765 [Leptospiraceae bacterium]|nr:hypothetical protein [Leptospiraceae bacterium]
MQFLAFVFLFSISIFSYPDVDVRGNRSENYLEMQGRATLRLPKLSLSEEDEVFLDFSVKNYGNEVIRFFPTTHVLKSFQFTIVDENDDSLSIKDELKIEDRKLKRRLTTVNLVGDEVKEIVIHKGESFTKRFNLKDYYHFEAGKKYFITGYFYPNYLEDNTNFLKTENRAMLLIEPKKKEIIKKKYESSEKLSHFEGLSPEEVVHLFLSAEMKKNWDNYFKHLHLSEFINSYTKFSKEYSNSEEDYKELVLNEFKKYLMEENAGKITYYKIQSKEILSSSLARVVVYVEREQSRNIAKYEYVYSLKKGDEILKGFWKINSVTVKVRR